jgi:hypothetical protein
LDRTGKPVIVVSIADSREGFSLANPSDSSDAIPLLELEFSLLQNKPHEFLGFSSRETTLPSLGAQRGYARA